MANVTKIYELRTLGFSDLHKDLQQISKDFVAIKNAKRDAEAALAKSSAAGNIEETRKYREELNKIKIEEAELRKQRQQMMNDQKAENIARQAAIIQERDRSKAAEISAGWYKRLTNEIKALGAAVKGVQNVGDDISVNGSLLSYDKAIAKLKELMATEQAYRRQFQADNTLVGEYTSGIVQAFKKMGLDDLIGGQVTKANDKLQSLNSEFNNLQRELSETRVSGQGSLESIEKQLIDNRKEAIALTQQVNHLQTELRGTGDIGNQITTSLSNGFKNLKGQIGQFVLGYVGFQAVFSGIQKTFSDTLRIDSYGSALKLVSGTQAELSVNTEFLRETVERLGLEYLSTVENYKSFYASATQAGISPNETREIFLSAVTAGAKLKLSQEQINGALLAFGQIASKGKVQAEELRGQIGERIPGAFSIAARAIGVTEQQLNKMLENGQVMSKDFLPKFAAELQKTFGTGASKVEGLQASVNRLKNEFTSMLVNNSGGLTAIFSLLINSVSILIRLLPALITLGTLLAANWAVQNAQLLLLRAQVIGYNIAIGASYVAMGILRVAQVAYNAVLFVTTAATTAATRALQFFGITIKATTGPLGVVLAIVGLLATAYVAFGRSLETASGKLSDFLKNQQALRDISRRANEAIAEQTVELNKWYSVAKDANVPIDVRRVAINKLIEQYPQFSKALQGEKIDLQQLTKAYDDVVAAINRKAFAQASSDLASDKQKRVNEVAALRLQLEEEFKMRQNGLVKLKGLKEDDFDLLMNGLDLSQVSIREDGNGGISFFESDIDKIRKNLERVQNSRAEIANNFNRIAAENNVTPTVKGAAGRTIKAIQDDLKAANEAFDSAVLGSPEKKALEAKIKRLNDELKGAQVQDDKPAARASRLTAVQKDAFKDIDAGRDKQLADERARRIRNEVDEETHLNNILSINQKAIDAKLKVIKGGNAEERKQIAELKLERITQEQETNNRVFAIRQEALQRQMDADVKAIRDKDKLSQDDINLSPTAKAQSKLDADKAILALQEKFNADIDVLEKKLGAQSQKNVKDTNDAIVKTRAQILEDEKAVTLSSLDTLEKDMESAIADIKLKFDRLREGILNSNRSASDKTAALNLLGNVEDIEVNGRLLLGYTERLKAAQELYKGGLITKEQYEGIYNAAVKGQETLNASLEKGNKNITSFAALLQNSVGKLFSFADGSDKQKLLGETISSSFNVAKDALNSYYDAQRNRIEESNRITQDSLDKEKEQALSRAQSQAERDAIERLFETKKDAANKAAFEKNKKLQIENAKINLATQLSNLAVIAFSPNPLNIATLGTAGAIMFGIQAALALASYALNVGRINSAKYEYGGAVPSRGGKFGGQSHANGGTPFGFRGESFEAEVDELAVIRTRNASHSRLYNVVGTQSQIASAMNVAGGGVNFAPGAKTKMFDYGGALGTNLQAPVFQPAISNVLVTNGGSNSDKMDELMNRIDALAQEQSKRIDRFEVRQVTSSVTDAQKKQVKQSAIGTL